MSFWQQVIDGIEIVTMEVILAVAPIVILFVLTELGRSRPSSIGG